jgi:hypothetical protein
MVNAPFVRMGPLPRSLAAEANECFTVRVPPDPTENKYAAQELRATAGSPRFVLLLHALAGLYRAGA